MNEPEGLTIGKIKLADGSEVLGVLAESWLTEGQGDYSTGGLAQIHREFSHDVTRIYKGNILCVKKII
ncbi:hypothetical protein [Escherichia coli]|uniref:hypothetical protein n=1 Tax=Escherichia coli TaxID=562 RepID=UPI00339BB93D